MYPSFDETKAYAHRAIAEAIDIIKSERREPTLWEARNLRDAVANLGRGLHILAVHNVNDAFEPVDSQPDYDPPEYDLVRRIDLDLLQLALHSVSLAPAAHPIFGRIVLT